MQILWGFLSKMTQNGSKFQVSISALEVRDGGKGLPGNGLVGGKAVGFDVIYEVNLFIGRRQRCHNCLKYSGFRFSEMHLMGQEEAIEMIVQMIRSINKIEMQVVAVREQVHLVACCAELIHVSESFSR